MDGDILLEKDKLLDFCENHKRIYIYGAGTFGKRYYEFLNEYKVDIEGFIVSKKNKGYYCNKKVYSLSEIVNTIPNGAGIIPGFENANCEELRNIFQPKDIDVLDVDHLIFLKLITCLRFTPIMKEIETVYGLARKNLSGLKFNSILIIRTDAIGDLICTTPFIREIRKNYPQSKITVVIRKSNRLILENCPYIDELLFYDSELFSGEIYEQCEKIEQVRMQVKKFAEDNYANRKFDAVFLPRELMAGRNILDELFLALESGAEYRFGHIIKTGVMKEYILSVMSELFSHITYTEEAKHEVMYQLSMLREIGGQISTTKMELWISKNVDNNIENIFQLQNICDTDYLIAVGFVASVQTRTWKSENYLKLFNMANNIYGEKVKFLVLGGNDAATEFRNSGINEKNVIDFSGKTSLEETAAIIKKCDLYIGSNTGLLHFASAYGKPSITIYAELDDGLDTDSDSPVKMGAWETENVALIPPAGLDGCHRVCRMQQSHCINQITADMVLYEIDKFVKRL